MLFKKEKRLRRHQKVRTKVFGTKERPRLCIFRSNKHIYAQLIDDEKSKMLAAVSDLKIKKQKTKTRTKMVKAEEGPKTLTKKMALAFEVGKLMAQKAKDLKIEKVVFDRGGYKYHGRVKTLAEGARAGGLKF